MKKTSIEVNRLPDDIAVVVARALAEDIGPGDVTAALLPHDANATARVLLRHDAVLCGAPWFDEVFRQLDRSIRVAWTCKDGDRVAADTVVCTIEGPARGLFTGERTALNFLQTLTGTASRAQLYSDAIAASGTSCRVLDTRKTIPGLRTAQKYAVRTGGCVNHRIGLYDAILIKENHIGVAGGVENAVTAARIATPGLPIEIEVESIEQIEPAIAAGANRLLLDNFSLDQLRAAVSQVGGRAQTEASGSITLDGIADIARTGVDYISTGALTKDVIAADFSMRIAIN